MGGLLFTAAPLAEVDPSSGPGTLVVLLVFLGFPWFSFVVVGFPWFSESVVLYHFLGFPWFSESVVLYEWFS